MARTPEEIRERQLAKQRTAAFRIGYREGIDGIEPSSLFRPRETYPEMLTEAEVVQANPEQYAKGLASGQAKLQTDLTNTSASGTLKS